MGGPRRSLLMNESQQIHLARQTVQLGVFAPEEIAAGLASGHFQATDLAWTNGMAAWKPLGEWPEFATVAPSAPGDAAPAAVSVIPWERGKSLGAFFATIKAATLSPRESLATGRFAFGDWLAFCYLALALTLPFQLASLFAFGDKNEQAAALLMKLGLQEQANQVLAGPPQTMVFQVIGLALAPLLYALFGVLHYLGQRLFRQAVTLERTVSAYLLAFALLIVLGAPLQLLGFDLTIQWALGLLLAIPMGLVFFRALGAATGLGAWVQFGIACFVLFILCCCCCFLPFVLLGGLAAGGV